MAVKETVKEIAKEDVKEKPKVVNDWSKVGVTLERVINDLEDNNLTVQDIKDRNLYGDFYVRDYLTDLSLKKQKRSSVI